MNLKTLYASAGILAVLAAIVYFVKTRDTAPLDDPRIGQPLVHPPSLRSAMKIALDGGDQQLTVARDSENSQWLLAERANLPVDMAKLSRAIQSVTESKLERLVTSKPERFEELGFAGESIAFLDAGGAVIAKVEVGRPTESGKQLVRLNDEDKAFLASQEISLDGDPDAWLAKSLLTFDRDATRSVEIAFANGDTLAAARDSADAEWQAAAALPEGKILDSAALARAVNRFAALTFTQTAALDSEDVEQARAHSHSYEIALADGPTYTVRIGRRPERTAEPQPPAEGETEDAEAEAPEPETVPAGPVYAFIESSDASAPINGYMKAYAFEVSAYTFTSLPADLAALLKDAPEPEPEPEAEPAEVGL